MKIRPYIDKLERSSEYKEFHKEHKEAFLSAGFFVLDFEEKMNSHKIDFYVPSQSKIAEFTLDKEVTLRLLETMNEKVPEKLNIDVKTDLDELYGILEDEMKNRGITENVKKIVAVLQNIDGKTLWNLNCVLSGMEILRANVDDENQSVLKMEKFSMMDLIRTTPGKAVAGLKKGVTATDTPGNVTKTGIKDQIKQIDKMEKVLEDQKSKLEKMDEKTQDAKAKKINEDIKKALKKGKN